MRQWRYLTLGAADLRRSLKPARRPLILQNRDVTRKALSKYASARNGSHAPSISRGNGSSPAKGAEASSLLPKTAHRDERRASLGVIMLVVKHYLAW